MLNVGWTEQYPSSNKLFYQWYNSVRGQNPSTLTVTAWAAFDVLEAALYRAASMKTNIVNGKLTTSSVLAHLNGIELPTPFGRVSFDANGVNSALKGMAGQILPPSTAAEIIYPTDVQTADFVYPMPTWDEREYHWTLIRGVQELRSITMAAICTFLLLLISVTAVVYRSGAPAV